MWSSRSVRLVAFAIGIVGTAGLAAEDGRQRLTPGEIKWPTTGSSLVGTSGVSGIQTVTLKGDPSKAGLYTILLRAGPNTRIDAHAHADDRVATVVSGMWYFGYGREFDEKALKGLPPGSFYTEPPGVDHFAMTKREGAVIQISGNGPSSTTYVDPRKEPARR